MLQVQRTNAREGWAKKFAVAVVSSTNPDNSKFRNLVALSSFIPTDEMHVARVTKVRTLG